MCILQLQNASDIVAEATMLKPAGLLLGWKLFQPDFSFFPPFLFLFISSLPILRHARHSA